MEESRFHNGTVTFHMIESCVLFRHNTFIIESCSSLIVSALEAGKKIYEPSQRVFFRCRTRDCV